jgi:hypothetical protein
MLVLLTSYGERAVARLLAQYQKPQLSALARELVERAQEVEATLFDVVSQTAIDTATGAWLDRLGAIVGEGRGGASDVDFRGFIRARVRANRSEGLVEDVLEVLKAWNGGTLPSHVFTDYPPAAFELRITSTVTVVDRLLRLLKATRAAGIGQMLVYQTVADSAAFTFSSTSALQASSTLGFGDSTNPATGGQFIGAERA